MKKMLVIAAALTCISATATLANAALASSERNAAQLRENAPEKIVLQFDEAVVREIMKAEGYDELYILNKTLELRQMDGRLQPVLAAYLKDRTLLETFVANGVTVKMVMVGEQINFWNGLFYLEQCLENPARAERIREKARDIEAEQNAKQLQTAPGKTVLTFDEAVVRTVLTEEGYDELFIINQLFTLRQRDGRLQPLLDAYLKDRSLSEAFAANGTTIKMVMTSQDKDFWNGLAYMEICMDNPDIAEHIRKKASTIEAGQKHGRKQR